MSSGLTGRFHRRFRAVTTGALLIAVSTTVGAQSKPPLKIGMVQHLTGAVAPYGVSIKVGAELAIKEINAKGGIDGRQIEFIVADDGSDVTRSVTETNRLLNSEKVEIMLTPALSQSVLANLPALNKANVLGMGMSGSDALTPKVGPYWFGLQVSADAASEFMVRYAQTVLRAKSVGIIGDGGSINKAAQQAQSRDLERAKVKFTGAQEYQYQSTDMAPQLLNLRRGSPEVLLLNSSIGPDTGNVLKSLVEIGWNDVKVVGNISTGLTSGGGLNIAPPAAWKNAVALNFKAFTYCPNEKDLSKGGAFVKKLNADQPAMVGKLFYPQAAGLYDAVYLIKTAVEASRGKTDGATLAKWILEKGKTFDGVLLTHPAPSKTAYFLVSSDALTMAHMDIVRSEDRMWQRADCKN